MLCASSSHYCLGLDEYDGDMYISLSLPTGTRFYRTQKYATASSIKRTNPVRTMIFFFL